MNIREFFYCVVLVSASSAQSQTVGRISIGPPVSSKTVADLEAKVASNPEDLESRVALLQIYAGGRSNDGPGRRIARLENILDLIDRHPEMSILATPLAYVARTRGAFANADDHQIALLHWRAAVDSHPRSSSVIVNAVRFLATEDQGDAETVLQQAIAADPDNREIAANLGFLYAMEILGLHSLSAGARSWGLDPDLAAHAAIELERSSNPFILAAAGAAMPNLAVKGTWGKEVDPKLFELASSLSARARQLAPGDPDIQGPMPLIRYFAAAHEVSAENGAPHGPEL